MSKLAINQCLCPNCSQIEDHPDKKLHHQMNLLLSRLDEQQRRWYVALEAQRIGHGGIKAMSLISGLDEKTIHRGIEELNEDLFSRPEDKIHLTGGGRKL